MPQIERVKKRARSALLAYRAIADGADCGHALLQSISPASAMYAARFDAAMADLRLLDPSCPHTEPLATGT